MAEAIGDDLEIDPRGHAGVGVAQVVSSDDRQPKRPARAATCLVAYCGRIDKVVLLPHRTDRAER